MNPSQGMTQPQPAAAMPSQESSMNHVLDELAPHKLMATRTGAIIRNKYSWTAIAKKLEGYFKEIAEKN